MRKEHILKKTVLFLIACFLITGCATPKYREIFIEKPTFNAKDYTVSKEKLFKAVMKVFYSKNFFVEKEDLEQGFILAKRPFQKRKRTTILALQAKITPIQKDTVTLYLNAIETTERLYVVDRTRFFMFIVPLPGGGGKEASRVKEGEKIIEDKKFYKSFFSTVDEMLASLGPEDSSEEEEILSHQPQGETPEELEVPAPQYSPQEKEIPSPKATHTLEGSQSSTPETKSEAEAIPASVQDSAQGQAVQPETLASPVTPEDRPEKTYNTEENKK
jgi:hypothetical protein